jgi:hypothetical protein
MKRYAFALAVFCLFLAASAVAFAQTQFYCVKADGTALASIAMPSGGPDDPADVCNAVIPQCYLTCDAVEHTNASGFVVPPNLPVVVVTPEMLPKDRNEYIYESPTYCAQQYQNCKTWCGGNRTCIDECKSIRSGCGTGNPEKRRRALP